MAPTENELPVGTPLVASKIVLSNSESFPHGSAMEMKQQRLEPESVLYEPKERNMDIASMHRRYIRCGCLYGLFWLLEITWWFPRDVIYAVLVAISTVQLLRNAIKTGAASQLHLLTMLFLVVVGTMPTICAMDFPLGTQLIWVLPIIMYFLYLLFLFCAVTNRLLVRDDRRDPWFDILQLICATLTSMLLFAKSSETGRSEIASLFCVWASLLWYVHATLLAARVIQPRATTGDPNMILHSSTRAAVMVCDGVVVWSVLPFLGNLVAACCFLVLLRPMRNQASVDSSLALKDDLCFIAMPIILAGFEFLSNGPLSLVGSRFHVRSDASILVETVYKTYLYEKVVRAELEPRSAKFPKQSETYHVYSERLTDVRRVVIELTEGRWLLINPESPRAFVDAVARAVEQQGKNTMHP